MKFLISLFLCIVLINTLIAQEGNHSAKSQIYVGSINVIGNKTTKSWVIEREMSLKKGDTLTTDELIELIKLSKENLLNTSLFNSVDIRYVLNDQNNYEIFVQVDERWYVFPSLIFELAETNFNSWLENKDFSRINYGIAVTHKNFRGRNEELKIHAQFGFTELLSLSYFSPYINKKKTLGFGFRAAYGQNHEINYNSFDNRRLFYKDIDEVQQRHLFTGINFKYRRKINHQHLMALSYQQVGISDTILGLNQNYLPGLRTNEEYLSLAYRFIVDKRDNKNYALEGSYLSANISKFGLGLLNSDVDLWWSLVEAKKYVKLTRKFSFAGMARTHFYYNKNQPYVLRDGMGYTDKSTVRSYELYVIDAQQSAIGKAQIRYNLKTAKPRDIEFIPFSRFRKFYYSVYLGAFMDGGYAWDASQYPVNRLANDFQYGGGFSLDITSIYDIVFRAEYSMNKFGEHRLFLHFVAPI